MNISELACDLSFFLGFYSTKLKEECNSRCPLECDSQKFDLTVSNMLFPTKAYAYQLVDRYINANPSRFNLTGNLSRLSYEELKNYFLAVNVYYGDMQYVTISEIEKTSLIDIVSGVGGTLGLFVGMSFMSFFELVDVLIETLFLVYENKNFKRNKVIHVQL